MVADTPQGRMVLQNDEGNHISTVCLCKVSTQELELTRHNAAMERVDTQAPQPTRNEEQTSSLNERTEWNYVKPIAV